MQARSYSFQGFHRRLHRWVAAVAIVAMAGWILEFAAHLHTPFEQDTGRATTHQLAHHCGYCAAMVAGAGPVEFFALPPRIAAEPVLLETVARQSTAAFTAAYFSRGPPTA